MFGLLLDVSGSMRNAYARDRSHDTSVRRTHAVLTTTAEIVRQEVTRHNRHDSIFTCAFGLVKPTNTSSCDLIPLLEALRESRQGARGPYDALIELAKEYDAAFAERWIRQHLTELEAILLNQQLRRDKTLIPKIIEKLPTEKAAKLAGRASHVPLYKTAESSVAHRSEAYAYAQDIVARNFAHPDPKSVQYVSKLMDDLLKSEKIDTSRSSRHCSTQDKVQELVDNIEPYIYGCTPMCEALHYALSIFKQADKDASKVLFILSDGMSTDGDPLPLAKELQELGVRIVTCYLTSDHIYNPKCLYGVEDLPPRERARTNVDISPKALFVSLLKPLAHVLPVGLKDVHVDGRSVLHKMSSIMKNTHTPVSYLVDVGWELSPSGESCLFVQANSLDVVDQFCKVVVSQMTQGCDALIDILGKVDTAMYINQINADFIPKNQVEGTCYANAVAAVLHLAIHRIIGREVPDFYDLREKIISEYGKTGANTKEVLRKVCPRYRLHFQEVDETGARKAINKRRPVVATFWLHDEEWSKFTQFFDQSKKGILKNRDVNASGTLTEPGGHAVVLNRCDPKCLTFMNSWGTEFADKGFFRVKDSSVLREMHFYDVYWTLDDLKESEKQAYEEKCTAEAKKLLEKFPSLKDLPFQCPMCKKISKVVEYYGSSLIATCPKCGQTFTPKNEDLLESLYIRNMKYT